MTLTCQVSQTLNFQHSQQFLAQKIQKNYGNNPTKSDIQKTHGKPVMSTGRKEMVAGHVKLQLFSVSLTVGAA
jgi:hypothetical protein